MNDKNTKSSKNPSIEDFKWLFVDAYANLIEAIIYKGYINGSEKAQLISIDILALGKILDPYRVLSSETKPLFDPMQHHTPKHEVQHITEKILKAIKDYRKKRKDNKIVIKKPERNIIEIHKRLWLTEDFERFASEMYLDLTERIIKEGYMNGSKEAKTIASNMVETKEMINVREIMTRDIAKFFEGIKTTGTIEDLELEKEHMLDIVWHYKYKLEEENDIAEEKGRIFPKKWITDDFKWLVLDAYVDLAERIIKEGYVDGSKESQLIAIDMVSLYFMIDTDDILGDTILGSFGSMEVPRANIEESTNHAIEGIKEYRKKRKKATK